MLELPGQSALSEFRLNKLLSVLRQSEPGIDEIHARYAYFVSVTEPLSAEHSKRLDDLLLSGDPVAAATTRCQAAFYRAPPRHDLPLVEQGYGYRTCLRPGYDRAH